MPIAVVLISMFVIMRLGKNAHQDKLCHKYVDNFICHSEQFLSSPHHSKISFLMPCGVQN